MRAPKKGDEVNAVEDVRRAIHPDQVDEEGEPTSAAFKSKDLSLDVASLASLESMRQRFRRHSIAILPCSAFRVLGYYPLHDPLVDNIAHAVVPGKIAQSAARKLAVARNSLVGPLDE